MACLFLTSISIIAGDLMACAIIDIDWKTESFYLRFSDRSHHFSAVAFTAGSSDNSPDYLYKDKCDWDGADIFIVLSSKDGWNV